VRIRFRFAKLGKIRFTGQRDVARMWERALRRARLPLAYSEGFSPRPQLSFGLALPTGCESEAEYLDVVLDPGRAETSAVEVESLPDRLTPLLPDGIEVQEVAVVGPGRSSLQQQVTSCSWTMDLAGVTVPRLETLVDDLLVAPSVLITRERKGRIEEDDLRPSVLALSVVDRDARVGTPPAGPATARLVAELATQPRGVRPAELVMGLAAAEKTAGRDQTAASDQTAGSDHSAGNPVLDRACRTHQWIERDGMRAEPLERRVRQAGADRAAHALERAS
jgi:radical SAM-linked protein